jgi:hypothetical protein
MVGLLRDSPGVKLFWALIATLLSMEYRSFVSVVPCILPSSVGLPALWWYVHFVIPNPVLTLRFMLSLTSDCALSRFGDMPAFLANMFECCQKIRSKQFFLSYWVISIVLLPWQAVSIVSSFSIAASIACLRWQDPCCLSKGDVFLEFC